MMQIKETVESRLSIESVAQNKRNFITLELNTRADIAAVLKDTSIINVSQCINGYYITTISMSGLSHAHVLAP